MEGAFFWSGEQMVKRKPFIRTSAALCLAISTAAAAPQAALAQSGDAEEKSPEELALEGVETLMRALELMIEKIPQYEMPEINEQGDIIIRRKNPPEPESSPDPDPSPDETET
jgi:hypothetical protein